MTVLVGVDGSASPSARLVAVVGLNWMRRRAAFRLHRKIAAAAVVSATGLDDDSVVNPASALCALHPHARRPHELRPALAYSMPSQHRTARVASNRVSQSRHPFFCGYSLWRSMPSTRLSLRLRVP